MENKAGRLVRRWAWVVAAVTGLAVAVGTIVFFATGYVAPLGVALVAPWIATSILAGVSKTPPRWLRAYLWVASAAAVTTFLFIDEDLGDRFWLGALSFVMPPLVLPLLVGIRLDALILLALAAGAVLAVAPFFVLKRWIDAIGGGHLAWIAWSLSLAVAIGIAAFSDENARSLGFVLAADAIALLGLLAPAHLARESRWLDPPAGVIQADAADAGARP